MDCVLLETVIFDLDNDIIGVEENPEIEEVIEIEAGDTELDITEFNFNLPDGSELESEAEDENLYQLQDTDGEFSSEDEIPLAQLLRRKNSKSKKAIDNKRKWVNSDSMYGPGTLPPFLGLEGGKTQNSMPVNRYESILRHLHFTNNLDLDTNSTDKLKKLRPFLDKLQKNFLSATEPEEYQAIDEQIVPLKGRLSIKQYLPKKPKKWGVKLWVRAGVSGYMYRFEVYQGAGGGREAISDFGACGDVIRRLSDDIQHKNHKLFFDHLFCSVPLLQELKQRKIWATATAPVLQEDEKKNESNSPKDTSEFSTPGEVSTEELSS
ncbi:uncharacterized protein LOC116173496 [Photinus pyralis]|uniref:uncharacterized protein LOC116173496 n=1 Tax=Photinus pyralis TaxID=7054 RepID=UPI0012671D4C|nr:uncharacterized protein LOC116173496 [Photinus pyralis]